MVAGADTAAAVAARTAAVVAIAVGTATAPAGGPGLGLPVGEEGNDIPLAGKHVLHRSSPWLG